MPRSTPSVPASANCSASSATPSTSTTPTPSAGSPPKTPRSGSASATSPAGSAPWKNACGPPARTTASSTSASPASKRNYWPQNREPDEGQPSPRRPPDMPGTTAPRPPPGGWAGIQTRKIRRSARLTYFSGRRPHFKRARPSWMICAHAHQEAEADLVRTSNPYGHRGFRPMPNQCSAERLRRAYPREPSVFLYVLNGTGLGSSEAADGAKCWDGVCRR